MADYNRGVFVCVCGGSFCFCCVGVLVDKLVPAFHVWSVIGSDWRCDCRGQQRRFWYWVKCGIRKVKCGI